MEAAQETTKLSFIHMGGIMSIGAHTTHKKTIQKNFGKVRKIQQAIQQKINPHCSSLSLGMSQDYVLALQAGATHLRIGTLLFQKRNG